MKTPGDLLFSILNTTYEFLGETGGKELLKKWCHYVAEHGVWSGVREAYADKGMEGKKIFLKVYSARKECLRVTTEHGLMATSFLLKFSLNENWQKNI